MVEKKEPEHSSKVGPGKSQEFTSGGVSKESEVKVEEKNEALSKEELLQKPTGTGKVKVGGEEAEPSESRKILEKAQEILKQYGEQESNIPVDNDYWVLMNRHRALAKDEKEIAAREREQKAEEKARKENK